MTLTTLDRKTALVVVDLQKGVVSASTVHPVEDIVRRARTLADGFRSHGLPVVLVKVAGQPPGRTERGPRRGGPMPPGFAELLPELDRRPEDHVVTKHARSAFTDTGLTEYLRELGVTQVVLAGISTSGGVESTARHAHEYGFNVTFALDAMTDPRPEAHDYSITRIFPRLGETGTAEQILSVLTSTRS